MTNNLKAQGCILIHKVLQIRKFLNNYTGILGNFHHSKFFSSHFKENKIDLSHLGLKERKL